MPAFGNPLYVRMPGDFDHVIMKEDMHSPLRRELRQYE